MGVALKCLAVGLVTLIGLPAAGLAQVAEGFDEMLITNLSPLLLTCGLVGPLVVT